MIPYAGIAFYTYEVTKAFMLNRMEFCTKYSLDNSGPIVLTIPANLCCGGLAGAVYCAYEGQMFMDCAPLCPTTCSNMGVASPCPRVCVSGVAV